MPRALARISAQVISIVGEDLSKEPVYVSPFVGRLDDHDENGMDLVKNIKNMYRNGDGHVHVLAASIRQIDHCGSLL
jgi:transaldolase